LKRTHRFQDFGAIVVGHGEIDDQQLRIHRFLQGERGISMLRLMNDSMMTWVRWLSSVLINGNARMPSHNFTTGVDSSAISRCWSAACP
jgi:hypothetical protein